MEATIATRLERLEQAAGLDDGGEVERTRAQRAAAQAEWSASVEREGALEAKLIEERAARVAKANASARSLAADLADVHETDAAILATRQRMQRASIGALSRVAVEQRFGDYLSGVLAGIGQSKIHYGGVHWHFTGSYGPATDWVRAEQRHLGQLTKEGN